MSCSFAAQRAAAIPMLRVLAVAGLATSLAACSQTTSFGGTHVTKSMTPRYAALTDATYSIPAVGAETIDPAYVRQRVRYTTEHPPGTVVVDPSAKFLYLVMEGGYAMRYGIGVGREGFGWSGTAEVRRKAQWPTWTPPQTMIARQPELERYSHGMKPGLQNPLGARALYLFQNGKDTLYRIHGTNEPDSIGKNVSSGCIRLINQDVIDLYNRMPVGSEVVVLPDRPQSQTVVRDEGRPAAASPE